MSNSSFYTQRVKNIYMDNKISANRIRSQLNDKLDPILQSTEKYNLKTANPTERAYYTRYLQISKPKDEKVTKQTINPKSNAFLQSDPDTKPKNYKIITDIWTRRSSEINEKSVKLFPNKLVSPTVGKLLTNNVEDDLRTTSEKKHTKNAPSSSLKKINDKIGLLPFEFEEKYNSQLIRRSNSNANVNPHTYQRVFQNQAEKLEKSSTQSFKSTDSKSKKFFKTANSVNSIGGLLEYEFGPKFRHENLTEKPNNVQLKRHTSAKVINHNSTWRF